MREYVDLHVETGDLKETGKVMQELGWTGFVAVKTCNTIEDIKNFRTTAESQASQNIHSAIKLDIQKPGELRKLSRKAIESSDFVYVSGGVEGLNRMASECWEVDLLCHPEKHREKDFINWRNSGLDHVMCKFMAERGMALEINFNSILNSRGMSRVFTLGRMMQNIRLARKYKVPLALTSGAQNPYELRSPLALSAAGRVLGMTYAESMKAVSDTPKKLIKKAGDRNDPDIILAGLEVVDWGELKPCQPKKRWGWY